MMRIVLFLIMSAVAFAPMHSQEPAETGGTVKELTKAQKKAIEKRNNEIRDSLSHVVAVDAMKKGYYVLMADRMIMRGGSYMNPTPNTNFLLVQGDRAVIQIASNNANPGMNGLGGITVEGRVTGLRGGEVDKKGRLNYDFSVSGPGVSAQVQVTLYKEDNQAVAIISPNFWSGNLTVYGKVVPYEELDYKKAIKGSTFP
ncbi:MAG: DUF4251 domain-containing protein [Muribaculaceae bacterium]|nr:DUF4251 domain-containing protein [Muribaculaceae bacterium]MEE1297554.1 DUF4251 domain-containing protein [Muribaculaceae bacterium]